MIGTGSYENMQKLEKNREITLGELIFGGFWLALCQCRLCAFSSALNSRSARSVFSTVCVNLSVGGVFVWNFENFKFFNISTSTVQLLISLRDFMSNCCGGCSKCLRKFHQMTAFYLSLLWFDRFFEKKTLSQNVLGGAPQNLVLIVGHCILMYLIDLYGHGPPQPG